MNTANLVGRALTRELDQMQKIRGVSKDYRIKAEAVVGAHDAKLKASGKLRSLVGVFVLGAILLFIAVSVLDAASALRAEWAQRRIADQYVAVGRPVDQPSMTRDALPFSDADPDAEQWPLEAQR